MKVDAAKKMEADAASTTSNDDSDEDADADADESTRGRKTISVLIAEMAIKTEQEASNSGSSKVKSLKEDEERRLELSRMSPAAMAAYIKELEAELYELSQREARELSRSKHLRIFSSTKRNISK